MGRTSTALVVSLAALCAASAFVACNPTSLKPGYCHTSFDCTSDKTCDNLDGGTFKCIPRDASMESMDARDAEVPFNCHTANDMCPADAGVCEPDAGTCVECTMDDHCLAKNINAPICQAQMCRACATDMECPDPKICLPDGHCATSGEVIYVEFNSNGCPGATGGSATPYCSPNEAVAQLNSVKRVIVIRGATNNQMVLATPALKPVVIGRKSSSGDDASIPATAAIAITVSSDEVLIRDLLVNLGSTATSKGIVASGSLTKVTLSNVQVNLGTGLGIQADTGALLTMDHCTVTNNSKGGIFLDGAQFLIKNTKVTYNGPGDDAGPWGGLRIKNVVTNEFLELVTVTNNNNVGISCSAAVLSNGVFASDNSGGLQVTNSCGITLCTQAGLTCGAQF